MSAAALLAELTALGATVQAVGENRLRIEAPRGALTPELRSALAQQKRPLLNLLRRTHLCGVCQSEAFCFNTPTICFGCRRLHILN